MLNLETNNIADPLSLRSPLQRNNVMMMSTLECIVTLSAVPVALKVQEIEMPCEWKLGESPKAISWVRNELTFIGQVILDGTRIVFP